MRLMRSKEPKATVTYNLSISVIRRIEELAEHNRTNRSYEAEQALLRGLGSSDESADAAETAETLRGQEVVTP